LIICPLTIPFALWGNQYHMGVLCDPIFWVVCWLLIGSPTAVQLTQITQLNGVFESEMATVSPTMTMLTVGFMVGLRCTLRSVDDGIGHK
jgi:predicted permease